MLVSFKMQTVGQGGMGTAFEALVNIFLVNSLTYLLKVSSTKVKREASKRRSTARIWRILP